MMIKFRLAAVPVAASLVKTCGELGIHSQKIVLPTTTTQAELLAVVHALNADPTIHGILVQSPLPPHIHEEEIIRDIVERALIYHHFVGGRFPSLWSR